jgi:hypothetical protein
LTLAAFRPLPHDDPDEGVRPIWGYLLALLVGLAVVAAVPWLSTGFLDK